MRRQFARLRRTADDGLNVVRYALRALRREIGGGDLLTVFAALALSVAVMTAVGTLVDRVSLALSGSAAEVIGGDLGLAGRQPPPQALADEARRRGFAAVRTVTFATVLFVGEASQLAEIKAVDAGYPLRGTLLVADEHGAGAPPTPSAAPRPGEAFADARLLTALGLTVGDRFDVGTGTLRIAARLHSEPDPSGELLQLAPRLLVNLADVESAGLLGPGSRAGYRLMFAATAATGSSAAATAAAIADFRAWLKPHARDFRLVGIDDTQRALRGTFDRASRFLALTALLAVLLAGVATALAANRFALRQIDTVAILRCLGARQRDILATIALQLLLLAVPACALGVGLGMLTQTGLVHALGSLIPDRLPLPQATPMLAGAGIGALLLLGFALPPLLRLRAVPPMRVLNRSFAALPPVSLLVYLAALAASIALAVFATRDGVLAGYVLGGLGALAAVAALFGWLLLIALRALQGRLHGPWRLGLAALARRRSLSVVQLISLSLSLCALLLLVAIGPGLLAQWRDRLPADTPNYFVLNIQPEQRAAVLATLRDLGVREPQLEPISTGRLIAINGQPPRRRDRAGGDQADEERAGDERAGGDPASPADDDDGQRPINFTWRHDLPPANTLTQGRFWSADSHAPEASVEQAWVERYGVALGDVLSLQLGERVVQITVTSIRKADWDSFRVNFFLVLNAGALGHAAMDRAAPNPDAINHDALGAVPYNLVSSFHLPPGQGAQLATLTRNHPNVSLLDIDAILGRVRDIIGRVAQAVQLVMGFSLVAGLLVLLAALQATAAERRYESAVLRTLGARRGQLRSAVLVEFAALGGIAATLAVAGAALIGDVIARNAFQMALATPWPALLTGGGAGLALAMLAGWLGTRRVLRTPPTQTLREA